MGRNKIVLIVTGLLVLVVIFVALIFKPHSTPKKNPATIVTDKQTGAQFYQNDTETPETGGQTGSQTAALVGADTLINTLTDNQLQIVRQSMSDYVRLKDSKDITLIKFFPNTVKVEDNNDISGTFNTDKGSITYNFVVVVPSINNIELKLSDAKQPNTVLYDTGYIDTSSATLQQQSDE